MIVDTELETWQQAWRALPVPPLTELKKKIRRQNRRTIAAAIVLVACLAFSTVMAARTRGSFIFGFAVGVWLVTVLVGSYTWWVRRGSWKPAAQTTFAYVELCHNRAIAKAKTVRFSFYFLLAATLLFAAYGTWHWQAFVMRDVMIFAAMVLELFFFALYGRRLRQKIEESRTLLDQIKMDQGKTDPMMEEADVHNR